MPSQVLNRSKDGDATMSEKKKKTKKKKSFSWSSPNFLTRNCCLVPPNVFILLTWHLICKDLAEMLLSTFHNYTACHWVLGTFQNPATYFVAISPFIPKLDSHFSCCSKHLAMDFSYTPSLLPVNRRLTFCFFMWRQQTWMEMGCLLLHDFRISSECDEYSQCFSGLANNLIKECEKEKSNLLEWRFSPSHLSIWGRWDSFAEYTHVTGIVPSETFYLTPKLLHSQIPGLHKVLFKLERDVSPFWAWGFSGTSVCSSADVAEKQWW